MKVEHIETDALLGIIPNYYNKSHQLRIHLAYTRDSNAPVFDIRFWNMDGELETPRRGMTISFYQARGLVKILSEYLNGYYEKNIEE